MSEIFKNELHLLNYQHINRLLTLIFRPSRIYLYLYYNTSLINFCDTEFTISDEFDAEISAVESYRNN